MKLILFDIDGTLIHSRGVGAAATRHAMIDVFGTIGRLDEFRFGGKTDWQMLLETLVPPLTASDIEQRLPEYDHVLGHYMRQVLPDFAVAACDFAPQLTQQVIQAPNLIAGILTANMPQAAHLKLQATGYTPDDFPIQIFGSQAPQRVGLPPLALQQVHRLVDTPLTASDVLIIGDTPQDIDCAHAHDIAVLAVATGRYTQHELAAHTPTYNIPTLETAWEIILEHWA